jgi:hypothetical protein
MNVFDESYSRIDDFISRKENSRLIAGTGRYSTLFRGSLFGVTETNKVVSELKHKRSRVLWLGSNPNVPESLELIKSNSSTSHYNKFLDQKNSGHFSEVSSNKKTGKLEPGWDPINKPNHQWKFYTDILDSLYGPGQVLMANFIPWGSSNFKQFLKEIKNIDRELLFRLLEFARELNLLLIEHLKPELIVVPKSICRSPINDWHLCCNKRDNRVSRRIKTKVPFIFTLDQISINDCNIKILTCPHPSYTSRVGKENRALVQREIMKVLQ